MTKRNSYGVPGFLPADDMDNPEYVWLGAMVRLRVWNVEVEGEVIEVGTMGQAKVRVSSGNVAMAITVETNVRLLVKLLFGACPKCGGVNLFKSRRGQLGHQCLDCGEPRFVMDAPGRPPRAWERTDPDSRPIAGRWVRACDETPSDGVTVLAWHKDGFWFRGKRCPMRMHPTIWIDETTGFTCEDRHIRWWAEVKAPYYAARRGRANITDWYGG